MQNKTFLVACLVVGMIAFGCSPEARDQYSNAGQDIGEATSKTGGALKTDAEKTKAAADNALKTTSVKSALQAASGLDTSNLNVDSDTEKMTVTLNGTVPDEAQRKQAQSVASGVAGKEFKIVNNLTVAPK